MSGVPGLAAPLGAVGDVWEKAGRAVVSRLRRAGVATGLGPRRRPAGVRGVPDSIRCALRAVVAGGGKLESAAVRVVQTVAGSLRGAGGKSELRRAVRWVTPSPGDRKESATENRPPLRSRSGKGEKVR